MLAVPKHHMMKLTSFKAHYWTPGLHRMCKQCTRYDVYSGYHLLSASTVVCV